MNNNNNLPPHQPQSSGSSPHLQNAPQNAPTFMMNNIMMTNNVPTTQNPLSTSTTSTTTNNIPPMMMNRHHADNIQQFYHQRSPTHQNFKIGESQPNLSSRNVVVPNMNETEHVFSSVNVAGGLNNNMMNNSSMLNNNNSYASSMQHSQPLLGQYSSSAPTAPTPPFQYHHSQHQQPFKPQQQPTTQFSNYVHNSYPQQQQQSYPTYTNYTSANNLPDMSSSNQFDMQQNYNNYELATSFNTTPTPPSVPSNNATFTPSNVVNNNNMPTTSSTDLSTTKKKRKKSSGEETAIVAQDSILTEHGHPIACVQCRSRHKKCDRTLPSCLNCTKRGVECTYRSPKMKGRKDQKFHPYSSLLYIPPTNTLPNVSSSTVSQPKPKKQKKEQNIINQIVDSHFTPQWEQPIEESNSNFNVQPLTVPNQIQNQLVTSQNASNFNSNDSLTSLLTSFTTNNNLREDEDRSIAVVDGFQNATVQQTPKIDRDFLLNLSKDSISDLLGSLGVNQTNFPNNININVDPNYAISHDLIKDAEMNQRLNMNAYKKRTIDLYDEVISMGYPLLSKTTLELAFFNEESMRGIYSNDVLALLYAIHAVTCQAFGVHDEANIGFQKSRTLLTENFDNSQNLFVAGTYCHFARYCSGIGDKGKAKFYLNYVDLFFRKRNKNFKNRTHLNYSIEEETKKGENYSIFNGLPVDDLHLLKYRVLCGISVDKSGEFFLNDSSNFPGFTFGSYVSKIICDGCLYAIGKIPNTIMGILSQKVSPENLNLYSMLVEFSANFLTMHEDERNISNTTRSIMKCLHKLFYHGCNVQLYKEAGVLDERIENEAKLFTLTTASEPFHLVQPLVMGALFETATIHLRILSEIEQGKRSFEELTTTYQLIELDKRALEIVRTKNKELIDRTFKPLLSQLQFRTRQFASLPFYNACSVAALIKDSFDYRSSPVRQDKFNDAINVLMEELNK